MPHDGNIDYGGYSVDELEEVLETIDRERYPVNFARLESELAARSETLPLETPAPEPGLAPATDSGQEEQVPSIGALLTRLVLGVAVLIYGAVGLVHDDILIPGRHRSLHLHGWAAWLLYGALLIAFAVNIAGLIDHRARLFRPPRYQAFRKACTVASIILMLVAVFGGSFR